MRKKPRMASAAVERVARLEEMIMGAAVHASDPQLQPDPPAPPHHLQNLRQKIGLNALLPEPLTRVKNAKHASASESPSCFGGHKRTFPAKKRNHRW